MAGSSLFALIDDIATLLDDVAAMTKTAAGKTSGVLGDDIALNAQQVSGIRADREWPIVMSIALGSLKNKAFLVPAALLLSAFLPWAIFPLLMAGGLFLCYEGAEKIIHALLHKASPNKEAPKAAESEIDFEIWERQRIRSAIKVDMILSGEIIVIALGIVAGKPILVQVGTLTLVALAMTIGVYGLVAALVKIDDLGLHLLRKGSSSAQAIGRTFVVAAPKIMHALAYAGTAAMFTVGGGILAHGIPAVHHALEQAVGPDGIVRFVADGLFGIVIGTITAALFVALQRTKTLIKSQEQEA